MRRLANQVLRRSTVDADADPTTNVVPQSGLGGSVIIPSTNSFIINVLLICRAAELING